MADVSRAPGVAGAADADAVAALATAVWQVVYVAYSRGGEVEGGATVNVDPLVEAGGVGAAVKTAALRTRPRNCQLGHRDGRGADGDVDDGVLGLSLGVAHERRGRLNDALINSRANDRQALGDGDLLDVGAVVLAMGTSAARRRDLGRPVVERRRAGNHPAAPAGHPAHPRGRRGRQRADAPRPPHADAGAPPRAA
jgi:hypothetical protein